MIMKKGVKKGFFTILIFSFILLSFGLVRAENTRGSHIIVHALNPEGIEIASIQGMNPYSVKIYDGDTLIGYGAHNEDIHTISEEIREGIIIDFDKDNEIIGMEILDAKEKLTPSSVAEMSFKYSKIELVKERVKV